MYKDIIKISPTIDILGGQFPSEKGKGSGLPLFTLIFTPEIDYITIETIYTNYLAISLNFIPIKPFPAILQISILK